MNICVTINIVKKQETIFQKEECIMGQRLNIEIHDNFGALANAYYHWSGYTSSSLELTQVVLDCYNKLKEEYQNKAGALDNRLFAIRLLESTGATLSGESAESIIKYYPGMKFENIEYVRDEDGVLSVNTSCDRNAGLIGYTEKDMYDTRYNEEARVNINIGNETVDFEVLFEPDYECIVEEIEGIDEDTPQYVVDIKVKEYLDGLPNNDLPYSKSCVPFAEFSNFKQIVQNSGWMLKINGELFDKIE
jgi:hypothetical protein